MMQMTTKVRYALRALTELAAQAGQRPVTRAELSALQNISADYIAQLFRHLQAAGLVHSVRGPGGGYVLARDAAAISVGDIVRATDGPIALAPCYQCGLPCSRATECVARLVWEDASDALMRRLDAWSLADVVSRAEGAPGHHTDGQES